MGAELQDIHAGSLLLLLAVKFAQPNPVQTPNSLLKPIFLRIVQVKTDECDDISHPSLDAITTQFTASSSNDTDSNVQMSSFLGKCINLVNIVSMPA